MDWWHPFSWIWGLVGQPLDAMVNASSTALVAWLMPGYKGFAVLAMAFLAVYTILLKVGDPVSEWLPHLIRVVMAGAVLSSAFLVSTFDNVILNTIPNGIIKTIGNTMGSQIPAGNVAKAFDVAWIDAIAAGMKIWAAQTGWSGKTVAMCLLALVYMGMATLAIVGTFAVWFATQLMLHLVAATAPIGIVLAAFSWTKQVFAAWLATAAGLGLTMGLVFLALGFVMGVEASLVHSMLTLNANTAERAGQDIATLILGGAVYLLFTWQLRQIPGLAMQLIGGAYMQLDGVVRATMTAPAAAPPSILAGAAAKAASAYGGGGSRGAHALPVIPPGRLMGSFSRVHV